MALIETLVCDNCGAVLKDYDQNSNTAKCPYCGAITTIINEAPTINIGTMNPTMAMGHDGFYHPIDSYFFYEGRKYYIDENGEEYKVLTDEEFAQKDKEEKEQKEKEEWERTHPEEVARQRAEEEREAQECMRRIEEQQRIAARKQSAEGWLGLLLLIGFFLFVWWFILHLFGSDPWQMAKKQPASDYSYSYTYDDYSEYQTSYYENDNYVDDNRPDNTLNFNDYTHP